MTIRYPRLMILFLRSRLAGPTLLVLTAVAAAAGFALDASDDADPTLLLRVTVPLAAAVAVGVAVRSPFGDAERTARQPLPPLRFVHLALLLACGVAGCALASVVPDDGSLGILLRNGAGFVGLALIGAWTLGTAAPWLLPAVAFSLLVVGLTIVVFAGARDGLDEGE